MGAGGRPSAPVFSDGKAAIRVAVIEDERMLADVIRWTLIEAGLDVVAVCSTGAEGLRAVQMLHPDLVLVDIRLPDQDGVTVGKQIVQTVRRVKVVAMTGHDDPGHGRQAMQAGFSGYLTKDTSIEGFLSALNAVMDGGTVFRHRPLPRPRRSVTAGEDAGLLASHLTRREREVLTLLARGGTNPDIGKALGISVHTVRSHVATILRKLQVHSRLEAVTFVHQHGLVERGGGPYSGSVA
jgi:DNA-binding NarL/FixJ family response regulator